VLQLSGKPAALKQYIEGKPAVMNFWAAWCSFCKEELPFFQKLHEEHPELRVVGINLQEKQSTVEQYWNDGGYTFPTLLDPQSKLKQQFDVFTQPTTFFIGANGEVVSRKDGPLNAQELEERVEELLQHVQKEKASDDAGSVVERERGGVHTEVQTSPVPPFLRSWYSGDVPHTVPLDEILSGGPSKDGIPSIDDPQFIAVEDVDFLDDDSPGVLLSINGDTRFYPFAILNWHEIVNDTVGGRPVAVTYCPLCVTAVTYSRDISEGVVEFGVSGFLYQSNLLMYDRATDSLWSQITADAVVGPLTGERLAFVRSDVARWEWVKTLAQPVKVLSTDTGYSRDYRRDPYEGYEERSDIFFPVSVEDDRLPTKAVVYGIVVNGVAKAYPKDLFQKIEMQDTVGGALISIVYDEASQSVRMRNEQTGEELIPIPAFWFSWVAVHPDTKLYE